MNLFPIIDGKEYIPDVHNGWEVVKNLTSDQSVLGKTQRADVAAFLDQVERSYNEVCKLTEFMSTEFLGLKHARYYGASSILTAIHFLRTHPERDKPSAAGGSPK